VSFGFDDCYCSLAGAAIQFLCFYMINFCSINYSVKDYSIFQQGVRLCPSGRELKISFFTEKHQTTYLGRFYLFATCDSYENSQK
jgi:hypothetical protein